MLSLLDMMAVPLLYCILELQPRSLGDALHSKREDRVFFCCSVTGGRICMYLGHVVSRGVRDDDGFDGVVLRARLRDSRTAPSERR